MRAIDKAIDYLVWLSAVAAAVMFAAMTVLISLEVVLRSFRYSMLFTDEYSGYMVLAIMALGAPYAREKNALLTVDFFFRRLPPKAQRGLHFVYNLLALVVCAMLTYYLAVFTHQSYERNLFSSTPMMTKLWIPQLVLPIGLGLLTVVFARKLYRPDDENAPLDIALQAKE
jgi:TRAP-type C4-dicarboxylate transport system permease small subunit